MENTTKPICRDLVQLLVAHGVKKAFLSPGTRNAPLLVAIARCQEISASVVVDERSAAFMALGYASVANEPVAIICTSGTALLNYAPAVAEAYYRKVPPIVISADRPMEWIDQDDSQTLRQPGALSNFVKGSYDIPDNDSDETLWYASRVVNDALLLATTDRRAPVHINLQLNDPLGLTAEFPPAAPKVINLLNPREDLTVSCARELGCMIASPRKVMIVAGFNPPDKRLNQALSKLARLPNFIVLTETVSNLHGKDFVPDIDTVLSAMSKEERQAFAPDVVITFGGALVSRFVKQYLRDIHPAEHWHVGLNHTTVDCFRSLTLRVEMDPGIFFMQLASAMQPHRSQSDYSNSWHIMADRADSTRNAYISHAPWSDLKALSVMLPMIGNSVNLQLSNGTPVRYAQILAPFGYHRCDCNRGVSGIDGSTSTAVGASMAYNGRLTLLITGDLSAQYDVGAFASLRLSPLLRIVVICNGGGGIFRFISTTSSLPELEDYFTTNSAASLPLRELAAGYGADFFEVSDEHQLRSVWSVFMNPLSGRAAIMQINTPPEESAEVLKGFFHRADYLKHKK